MHRAQTVYEPGCSGFWKHQFSQARLCDSTQALGDWMIENEAFMRRYAQAAMYMTKGLLKVIVRTLSRSISARPPF